MAVLGYNTIGGTSGEITKWWSCKFTTTEAGEITDLNFYGDGLISIGFKLCIWADNAGSPGALLAESASGTMTTTPGWWTRPISYTFGASEVLHLGFVGEDWIHQYRDAGSTNQYTEFTEDYTGWPTVPDPPTVDGQYDILVSIYANYTPASAGNTTNFFQFF